MPDLTPSACIDLYFRLQKRWQQSEYWWWAESRERRNLNAAYRACRRRGLTDAHGHVVRP